MSYLNRTQDPRRRATAIAGTVIVHAALGIAVVTGLTIAGYQREKEHKPTLYFPLPDPPKPAPEPQRKQESQDTVLVVPTPTIDVIVDPPVLPTVDRNDDTTFVVDPGTRIDPVVPADPPSPAFTPRKARPSNDPLRWISTDDYPARALRAEAEGSAAYRLIVGTNGRVSACEVVRSTGNGMLDDATCDNIVRRARFEAATDDTGAKVVGSYSGTVKWEIPD